MKLPAAYFATALSALCHVVASPLQAREVFNPPVLDPNTETIWVIGTTRNVTRDTSGAPTRISGHSLIAFVKGGLIKTSGPGSLEDPLASEFSLLNGVQEVTVPVVEPGDDYQLVLFGSSDNWSQVFSITN